VGLRDNSSVYTFDSIPYRVEEVDGVRHQKIVRFTNVDVKLHRIKDDFGAEYFHAPCIDNTINIYSFIIAIL